MLILCKALIALAFLNPHPWMSLEWSPVREGVSTRDLLLTRVDSTEMYQSAQSPEVSREWVEFTVLDFNP